MSYAPAVALVVAILVLAWVVRACWHVLVPQPRLAQTKTTAAQVSGLSNIVGLLAWAGAPLETPRSDGAYGISVLLPATSLPLFASLSGLLSPMTRRTRFRRRFGRPSGTPDMPREQAILKRLALLAWPGASADSAVVRTGIIVYRLAELSGLGSVEAAQLQAASSLYRIGRIAVPDDILRKSTPLDPVERAALHRAPEIGFRLLAGSGSVLLDRAAEMALGHQERWDGTGYPGGLAGTRIPLVARIIAVAARFETLLPDACNERSYMLERAMLCLRSDAGQCLDPFLTMMLLDTFPFDLLPDRIRKDDGRKDDGRRDDGRKDDGQAVEGAAQSSVFCLGGSRTGVVLDPAVPWRSVLP